MPDFANVRRSTEPCTCGSDIARGKCCHQVPYAISNGRTMFDDTSIEPSAVVWQALHLDNQPCDHCPHCVGFPCISKLQKIVNHPSLLLVDPKENNATKRKYTKLFAEHVFTPQMLAQIHPDSDDRYERTMNMLQLSDT